MALCAPFDNVVQTLPYTLAIMVHSGSARYPDKPVAKFSAFFVPSCRWPLAYAKTTATVDVAGAADTSMRLTLQLCTADRLSDVPYLVKAIRLRHQRQAACDHPSREAVPVEASELHRAK